MSAPRDQPRKRPAHSPIPVAGDEPQPVASCSSANLTVPATIPEPHSPSSSRIQNWRRRIAHRIESLVGRICGRPEEPATPEEPSPLEEPGSLEEPGPLEEPSTPRLPAANRFEMVRRPRIRPTVLVQEGGIVDEQILWLAPRITHLHSLIIRDAQCFVVSSRKALNHRKDIPKLRGVCVGFRERRCNPSECADKCVDCKVCPHMYYCTCPVKYMGTEWCAHMHVMHQLTEDKFLQEGLLFIQGNYRFTEMRHLRAFIQGSSHMKKYQNEEGVYWEEQFEHIELTEPYRVYPLEEMPCDCPANKKCELCDVCLCKYICDCEDHREDMQVCEHIHNVAMQMHERSAELFRTFTAFGSGYPHTEGRKVDSNRRYYLEQEHQMSADLDLNLIVKQTGASNPQEWHIRLGEPHYPPLVILRKTVHWECYCNTDNATKSNCCVRCGVCENHYTCNCGAGQYTICQHMHALARKERKLKLTPEQQFDHLLQLVAREVAVEQVLATEQGIRQFRIRAPTGLTNLNRSLEDIAQLSADLMTHIFYRLIN